MRQQTVDGPVIASFRTGPSFPMFATFWPPIGPIRGLALQRSGTDVTERFVVIRRLRHARCFDRASTEIKIANAGGSPVAHITDHLGARQRSAVSALNRPARKLREMVADVPVTAPRQGR